MLVLILGYALELGSFDFLFSLSVLGVFNNFLLSQMVLSFFVIFLSFHHG